MRGPFKNYFLVCCSLWVSWTRPPWLSKLDVVGACRSGASLKSWGAREKLQGEPVTHFIAVATLGVGFMATLWLRPLLATSTGVFRLCPVCGSCSASSGVFIFKAIVP